MAELLELPSVADRKANIVTATVVILIDLWGFLNKVLSRNEETKRQF